MLHIVHAMRRGDRRSFTEDPVLTGQITATRTEVARAAPTAPTDRELSSEELLDAIMSSLSSDKAEEIVAINLAGRSAFADHMVIASGRSTRQVAAISEKLVERLKELTGRRAKVEGKDAGDWVLIDAGDVIVHVFRPEVREFYQLEKMWATPADSTARAATV